MVAECLVNLSLELSNLPPNLIKPNRKPDHTPKMTSPVCTHCTEVIRELLRDRRPLTYSEVVAYPQSCHFCANLCDEVLPDLAASYSLTDVKYFISERSSPGSYHLTVDYEGSHMKPGRNGQIMGIQAFLIEPESGILSATLMTSVSFH